MPKVKIGIVAVSRDCFPESLSVNRRKALVEAYAAKYAAKNIVAQGYARKCELQLAYAIGVAKPVSVRVDTFGTGTIPDSEIEAMLVRSFDFRPAAIIERLRLRQPIYRKTAAYGHFGREDECFPWEKLDLEFIK